MQTKSTLQRVLVTGSSGFIGACAVRTLLERGYDVHVLLRSTILNWRLKDLQDKITTYQADLLNAIEVKKVIHSAAPDVILHLATHGAYQSQNDTETILQTNIFGTWNLLSAAKEEETSLFVNIGSTSEYGFATKAMQEDDRLEPNSYYAVAKATQTHLCKQWSEQENRSAITFRLFSTYGPWETPSRLMPTMLTRIANYEPLNMVSRDTVRDFIFIDDVLDAILNFGLFDRYRGEVFNVCTGRESRLDEVVEIAQKVIGNRVAIHWGNMSARPWDAATWKGDPSKIIQHFDWKPKHSLHDGLSKMHSWMLDQGLINDRRSQRHAV